jgi:hypothetical protein
MNMAKRFWTTALGMAAAALAFAPALAHHSYSMFDGQTTVTLEGTVAEFQWVNPHAWIFMDVPGEDGEMVRWALELPSPGGLARNGWRPRSLTPGMQITATAHPLKDGHNGGGGLSVTLADGTMLSATTNNVTRSDEDAQ